MFIVNSAFKINKNKNNSKMQKNEGEYKDHCKIYSTDAKI